VRGEVRGEADFFGDLEREALGEVRGEVDLEREVFFLNCKYRSPSSI
jgi:hypothetical protein